MFLTVVDIGSELHIVAIGGPVYSTPKRQQNTASPDLGHELFDALALNPHQNMLVPSSTSLHGSSDPFPSGSSPVEIASQQISFDSPLSSLADINQSDGPYPKFWQGRQL